MDKQKFIELFIDLFDEQPLEKVTVSSQFKDLEDWDSLVALSFMAMITEEYGVDISADDVRTLSTIQDILDLIVMKSK